MYYVLYPDAVAQLKEWRLPVWKVKSSNPGRVKAMIYKMDTCPHTGRVLRIIGIENKCARLAVGICPDLTTMNVARM